MLIFFDWNGSILKKDFKLRLMATCSNMKNLERFVPIIMTKFKDYINSEMTLSIN